uniref:TIGR03435 family protein n=1 Tax=Solibacter usitatus (strain Ellin6076) TaxID=234267 RepID=Q01X23_SOLUE
MRTLTALLFASVCWSQQAEFEVASVKPNTSARAGSDFNRTPGGGLHAINVTLREMILFAYEIRDQQLIGGPAWMGSDRYDVMAKPSQNDNPAGAKRSFDEDFRGIRLKMRALLADRFQLAIHRETRDMPIYTLVAAKNGPRLDPSKSEDLRINNRRGLVICKKVTMKAFAESSLTYRMGRTVVDKTGTSGEFDFELKFREDQDVDSTDPDFLTAMREQLGLVLHSEKGPVEVIVVDDAKKASAN